MEGTIKHIGCEGEDWIQLAQDRVQCRTELLRKSSTEWS